MPDFVPIPMCTPINDAAVRRAALSALQYLAYVESMLALMRLAAHGGRDDQRYDDLLAAERSIREARSALLSAMDLADVHIPEDAR